MRYNEIKNYITEGPLQPGNLTKDGPDSERMQNFINKIKTGSPFELNDGGTVLLAKPKDQGGHMQNVIDRLLQGQAPGALLTADGTKLAFNKLKKTTEFGGQTTAAGEVKTAIANRGNVMEGVLGAATTARLMKRPGSDITVTEVLNIIKKMPKGGQGGVTKFQALGENNITDIFELTVRLDPAHYEDFIDIDLLQRDTKMSKYLNQVVAYCNDAATVDRYAKFFETNDRPDIVQIIADGISDNTGRKTDIFMIYVDENGDRKVKHFDISLKAGTTPQFGQSGGGSSVAPPNQENFTKLKKMFEVFGCDIQPVEQAYLASDSFAEAYTKGYAYAAKTFNSLLAGSDEDKEMKFMQKFINGIKYHGTLNDDNVKLLQFEENKFYLLDFSKLDRLYDKGNIDMAAKYQMQGNGLPVLLIYNKNLPKQNVFMSIRPKPESGKTKTIRNLIQKGPELKRLTMVRSTKKKSK